MSLLSQAQELASAQAEEIRMDAKRREEKERQDLLEAVRSGNTYVKSLLRSFGNPTILRDSSGSMAERGNGCCVQVDDLIFEAAAISEPTGDIEAYGRSFDYVKLRLVGVNLAGYCAYHKVSGDPMSPDEPTLDQIAAVIRQNPTVIFSAEEVLKTYRP